MMNFVSVMRVRSFQLLVSMLLSIQLFNFSIDPADPAGLENVHVNEIESFLELLCENILGHENTFQETGEGDDNTGKRELSVSFIFSSCRTELAGTSELTIQTFNPFIAIFLDSFSGGIITPPPRSLMS